MDLRPTHSLRSSVILELIDTFLSKCYIRLLVRLIAIVIGKVMIMMVCLSWLFGMLTQGAS